MRTDELRTAAAVEETALCLDQDFTAWRAGLSHAERAELRYYQGIGYDKINRLLRAGDRLEADALRRAELTIDSLDSAIMKGRLERDLLVYRGVVDARVTFGLGVLPGLQPGDPYTDLGYMSTSIDPLVARRKAGTARHAMLVQIEVTRGQPAAWMPSIEGPHRHETELLLPRRTRSRFVDLIDLEDIPMIRLSVERPRI